MLLISKAFAPDGILARDRKLCTSERKDSSGRKATRETTLTCAWGGFPNTCSGDMYDTVPNALPGLVKCSVSTPDAVSVAVAPSPSEWRDER
jgi:hypothetical protein